MIDLLAGFSILYPVLPVHMIAMLIVAVFAKALFFIKDPLSMLDLLVLLLCLAHPYFAAYFAIKGIYTVMI